MLDLKSQDSEELNRILKTFLPNHTVWAFGSRVTGNAKPYSDLDLVIVTTQPLSLSVMAELKTAFAESDLTIRVDLVDWAVTSDTFRNIIQQNKLVVQEGDFETDEDNNH
ncbi:nucleotidyltransferase domain-containing protein [Methylocucumis oryzae]|uniref:DNA polymerase beta subunit n=1 Tax=Methylocucumis oryzae TaxID=1632867 RepID=A0A0F3IL29_9GAMM|nr:nucleotidyltransferase domain-containing protein [Methylocucumis oryzae]KJV07382.1 DNA polymerase beta subunit [Methylocucumis oryzae]